MINFGGVDLTDIAPVKIEDIQVSPIALSPVTRQRAIRFGSEFVRMGGSSRTVTISFALLEMDSDERETAMQKIRDWASISEEKTLELPQFSDRHLECVCTQHPEHSYRKWWETKLKLVFTCYSNPFWTSNDLVQIPCGTPFSIGGSAQPLITIERNGATTLSNVVFTDGSSAMTFSTIPPGRMVIDLNRQTASISGSSIMRYYVNSSSWIVPKIGSNQTIYGTGSIRYRERWV